MTSEPTGAPSPLDRHTDSVSNSRPYRSSGTPSATEACQIRAPSQCSASPCPSASRRRLSNVDSGSTAPPPRLCVCSTATARVATAWYPAGRTIAATVSTSRSAATAGQVRVEIPPIAAAAPISYVTTCASASHSSSSPGGTSSCTAIWLAIEPVGVNSAASCPNIAATRASSALTVGSSAYTSSPTSAAAIAARIPAVGFVTVSDRRSTTSATEHLRHEERQLQGLLGVQPGVARRLVAVGQVHVLDGLRATEALRHVLPSQ